ncbi:MAG: tripartite tricarboxylate transporter substrate binding protein [Acetobacteraceae bacterium]|nr:tripartite tricarboxylate transporter substrate binding protein [Acetobacteraceae bacterium]
MLRRHLLAGAAGLSPLAARPARAQEWRPERPIRVVVPFPAGGATDVWARLCAEPMSEILGVPVLIENRSGAGGMIGADAVAKAAPDGHTLLFTITSLVQAPVVLGNAPYDAVRDFTPIGRMGSTTLIFVIRAEHPARNLAEFIPYARGRGLTLGSWAAGSSGHVFGLAFNNLMNLGMTHVAYRGEAPMVTAFLSREVDAGINSLTSVREHIASGRLRPLAALGSARAGTMPEVPTFLEQGVEVGRDWSGFVGLLGPARLPAPILARLAETFRLTMAREALQRRLREIDTDPGWAGPEAFGREIATVRDRWIEITRGMDLQLG